ncbi:hypothetical protein C8J56DRAFT_884068 [Mycena floridula]|nr:hypothetical protein C8J56DRAFT_884068 [Mycena floridula]
MTMEILTDEDMPWLEAVSGSETDEIANDDLPELESVSDSEASDCEMVDEEDSWGVSSDPHDWESVYETACEGSICKSNDDLPVSESEDTMEGAIMDFGPDVTQIPLGNIYAEYALQELTRHIPYPGDNPPDHYEWADALDQFSVMQTEDGYVILDGWHDCHEDFEDGIEKPLVTDELVPDDDSYWVPYMVAQKLNNGVQIPATA